MSFVPGENLIPARLCNPPRLKDETGQRNGALIQDVLSFELQHVVNLYDFEKDMFSFKYVEYDEHVDALNPATISEIECEIEGKKPRVDIDYVEGAFTEHGINYLGYVSVKHNMTGKTFYIKLIGELTYDPAGVTTSMHASERVGGDCFSMQLGVTVSQIMAFKFGCPEDFIYEIQQVTLPTIRKYHERFFLHEYMGQQVMHACFLKTECPPYGDYLLDKVQKGEMRLDSEKRIHTIEYLEKYCQWKQDRKTCVCAPAHYYKKIVNQIPRTDSYVDNKIGLENYERACQEGAEIRSRLMDVQAPLLFADYCTYLASNMSLSMREASMDQELEDCQNTITSQLQAVIQTYRRKSTKSLEENSYNKQGTDLDTFVLPDTTKDVNKVVPDQSEPDKRAATPSTQDPGQEIKHGVWNEGLFGCFSDCFTCSVVSFVPCGSACVQGLSVDAATGSGLPAPCFLHMYLCWVGAAVNRGKIRKRYEIEGSFCVDVLLNLICAPCMVCQEYREVDRRKDRS